MIAKSSAALEPNDTYDAQLAADIAAVSRQLRRRLRIEGGTADVTASQASALGQLEKMGQSTVGELAQVEGVRPQSMGATIASLETLGFVVGTPDPADGRRIILSLSPMAVEKFSVNRAARQGWLFRMIQQQLSVEERWDLARGLEILTTLIEL